jgi:hypothetical protein
LATRTPSERAQVPDPVPDNPQLAALAAQFEPGEHKERKQAGQTLTYISIDATINRLNAVLGPEWGTTAETKVTPQYTTNEDDQTVFTGFLAVTELQLRAEIDGFRKTAYGVGAMINRDPDMAAKTALAEAIKKAGHQLGIGLYLWDADARAGVSRKMKLANATAATLKQEVFKLAVQRLGKDKPSAKEIAGLFGVEPGELADEESLKGILEKEGLL